MIFWGNNMYITRYINYAWNEYRDIKIKQEMEEGKERKNTGNPAVSPERASLYSSE